MDGLLAHFGPRCTRLANIHAEVRRRLRADSTGPTGNPSSVEHRSYPDRHGARSASNSMKVAAKFRQAIPGWKDQCPADVFARHQSGSGQFNWLGQHLCWLFGYSNVSVQMTANQHKDGRGSGSFRARRADLLAKAVAKNPRPYTLNLEPLTLNPKHST